MSADMSESASSDNKALKKVFQKYAAFGRPGQTKDMTSKNFSKLMKECSLMDKKVNQTEIDIIFTRAKSSPAIKVLTFDKFQASLVMIAKSKYGTDDEANVNKVKALICSSSAPSVAGTTSTSVTGKVDRLTDVTKYTGQHKERFAQDGAGKGKDGREYLVQKTGYVHGYKGKDTYDGTH